ncbi:PREDICTED: uncharacterized protein LOC106816373 [Priapulus caudatus]|uniref:Uncharacterized protein LOC106816373 n=1 Tax=Priapulus caudatus TaxID=37621 RepID=A0ABM1EW86_PRICU|nr:PREDICTED: uncharacterized protein LOC106816373 [Priapulus caudatus]
MRVSVAVGDEPSVSSLHMKRSSKGEVARGGGSMPWRAVHPRLPFTVDLGGFSECCKTSWPQKNKLKRHGRRRGGAPEADPRIYDGLVEFASPITQQSSGDTSEVSSSHPAAAMRLPLKQADAKDSKPSPVKPTSLQMFFSSTPPGGPTGPKSAEKNGGAGGGGDIARAAVGADPARGKALQVSESYAIGVCRRIKMSNGRDPDRRAGRLNVARAGCVRRDAMQTRGQGGGCGAVTAETGSH